MIIFKDIVSDDEMFSDANDPVLVDDLVYEVNCDMITLGAVNVDTGANASAEEADEALEDADVKVNSIIHSFRLQETSFDKAGFLKYLKGYLKTLKAHLQSKGASQEEVDAFEKRAGTFVKEKLLKKFKDFEFYVGEGMNPDGMIALLNYREDGVTPYFTFWKDGLSEMKV